MWVIDAFGAAFFAGVTAVVAKIGIKNVDSDAATAIRTVVILAFSWLSVLLAGSYRTISEVSGRTLLFFILSGMATGMG